MQESPGLKPDCFGDIKSFSENKARLEHQTLLGKHKDVSQGIEKLKKFHLKLHINESVTPTQQPVRRLPYQTPKKVSKEITRLK